jgi:hypothetical protein
MRKEPMQRPNGSQALIRIDKRGSGQLVAHRANLPLERCHQKLQRIGNSVVGVGVA